MSDKKINMPSGMAGITRYGEEYHSRIVITPVQVFVIIGVIVIILLTLLANNGSLGYKLLGIGA